MLSLQSFLKLGSKHAAWDLDVPDDLHRDAAVAPVMRTVLMQPRPQHQPLSNLNIYLPASPRAAGVGLHLPLTSRVPAIHHHVSRPGY